jgi:hypothetical protein
MGLVGRQGVKEIHQGPRAEGLSDDDGKSRVAIADLRDDMYRRLCQLKTALVGKFTAEQAGYRGWSGDF